MTKRYLAMLLCGFGLIAACTEEPKPRSVNEFLENPIVLEAAVVRCAKNREKTRYDAECVNARQAITILEAREDREKAKEFEAQSERKREALRRTQQAAMEARRRAEEAERMRREAEYLAQFGELPPAEEGGAAVDGAAGNAPVIEIPEPQEDTSVAPPPADPLPEPSGSNAPVVETEAPTDLNAIREELQKRSEDEGG